MLSLYKRTLRALSSENLANTSCSVMNLFCNLPAAIAISSSINGSTSSFITLLYSCIANISLSSTDKDALPFKVAPCCLNNNLLVVSNGPPYALNLEAVVPAVLILAHVVTLLLNCFSTTSSAIFLFLNEKSLSCILF